MPPDSTRSDWRPQAHCCWAASLALECGRLRLRNSVSRGTRPAGDPNAQSGSLRQLKPLEPVERFLDAALELIAPAPRSALADPAPFLHQQLFVLAVGLQIDGGDDLVTDEHRQRKVAEQALFLRHIG